jgi:predicted oxidoreductase
LPGLYHDVKVLSTVRSSAVAGPVFLVHQVGEGGKISFKASGQIDFFGEEALTRVGGAGGQIESVRAYRFTLPVAAWTDRPLGFGPGAHPTSDF